jgi:hypothetical protein
MSDSQLLVPMHLDAMVLNQEASAATPFLRFQMQYGNLQFFQDPEPPPFGGGSATQPGAGIYLQWTVPDALRHGTQNDDGSTSFPYLPNRWLVARMQDGAPADQAVKAWIVESDFTDPQLGTSAFVDPTADPAQGVVPPTLLGKAVPLTATTVLDAPAGTPFLQAVGPGSVTFAAYAPGVDNVLSFIDDVTDGAGAPIATGTFTYHVAGWYDPPGSDPLAATSWAPSDDPSMAGAVVNDTFGWVLYAGGETPPSTMLVHALVASVPWDASGENPPPGTFPVNVPETVKVAFGSTAVDALAAIVRLDGGADAAAEADLLEAFQYGALEAYDHPGSAEELAMEIRQHWYAASPGGTLWTVVAAERTGSTALPAPPPPVLDAGQLQALAALNQAQRTLDRQSRILESMQWTLFSLWWKTQWQNANNPPVDSDFVVWLSTQLPLQLGQGATCNDPGGTDPAKESWYLCKVQAQQNQVAQLQASATAAQQALLALLDSATQVLKPVNLPQFWAANDPVMLVTGLGRSTSLDPVENLVCRLPSQAVAALTVSGTTYCADGSCANSVAADVPVLAAPAGLLPASVAALHTEAFFLSPELFAQNALGDATQADAVRAAIAALPAPGTAATFPPYAGAMGEWTQPWVPLLLDWEVTVLKGPAYVDGTSSAPIPAFQPQLWSFDGTGFSWSGPTTSSGSDFNETDSMQMQLSGRTFITPQITTTLASQLQQWIDTHQPRDPSLKQLLDELETYLQQIQSQDILSQRLSGMMQMLTGRDVTQSVPPYGDVRGVLGDSQHGIPNPFPDQVPLPVWDFAPAAGSYFVVNRLSVIDAQGRTVDLTLANDSTWPGDDSPTEDYFYPIAGRGLYTPLAKPPAPGQGPSTDPTQRMLQMEPRMVQDARLALSLLTADGTNQDVTLTAGESPVCGWIVPNHLDRSLALYAPDGTAWGELYLSLHENGYLPVWQPDPTNPSAPATVADIPNPYVSAMLAALVARTDDGAGFWDFFRAIDETLWTINPRGGGDANLAVLVGRPLAVVRAELALQLRGQTWVSQDWWNTFDVDPGNLPDPTQPAALAAVDGGVATPLWNVRVGSAALPDDGVVGYFLDDPADPAQSWSAFNAVVLPQGADSGYVQQIGPGNYLRLRFADDTVDAPDPAQNQLARLTLLVDPNGGMHAFSGLLPVTVAQVPAVYTAPPLEKISYLFRAGPFLTSPDQVRIPRPAETHGTWAWFDHVLDATTALAAADGKVSFPATPPLAKEGWLKFTPNPPTESDT